MKIAITADIHLKKKNETPERWNAIYNIVQQMRSENIDTLIIAGDLFDKETQNYSEFDEFCKKESYIHSTNYLNNKTKSINNQDSEDNKSSKGNENQNGGGENSTNGRIKFYIIPGNHDPSLRPGFFTSGNIKVITSPSVITSSANHSGKNAIKFFLIPYTPAKSIGEVIAEEKEKNNIPSNPWILVGHGDYIAGLREPNPYEPGIYMPLTRNDIDYYNPDRVILGHIHKKMSLGKVYYPGSPCGLDINETGKRSFLIIDTDTLEIIEKNVKTDYIFFNETLIVLPTTNEFDYIKEKISKMIKKWEAEEENIQKIRIRLKVKGFTSDRNKLFNVIKESLKNFSFYNNEEPDLTEVLLFSDPERITIIEKVRDQIEKLEWNEEPATKDDILEKALHLVLREI
ncbi:MAG: metallophosphoesterase [Actinobacteria bacterium]|nr:metallophosphoesterase [Actinomycetota bacterium]